MNELTVILLMSFFCVGLFFSMQREQIFSFLRTPVLDMMLIHEDTYKKERGDLTKTFQDGLKDITRRSQEEEWSQEQIKSAIERRTKEHDKRQKELKQEYEDGKIIFYLLKPFILCVWCFASVWGSVAFWSLHYFYLNDCSTALIPIWIISMFACIVLNATIDAILHKLDVY